MATVQKLPLSTLSTASSYGSCKPEGVPDQFPAGLRVLVVDDDTTCLKILEQMLKKCLYHVTTCCRATVALSLLRERKGGFDVVISDVHMPDMDGFKLLEHVGLEMDLPVIMMSADGRTSAVMNGIKHGACDYLIKPIRIEELKNIWQHVVRKKWNESKELEQSGSVEDTDRHRRTFDDSEYASSVNEGTDGNWKVPRKRRDAKEEDDDGEQENDDSSASKKPRVVWSVELHQQFVSAVNQLGIDKAVPKRILELMNVPGLTRENVASHLQKFRLYLKRLSGVAQHQGGIPSSFCGPVEPSAKLGSLGRLDIQALAASGQLPPQTLAALHAEFLGHPAGSIAVPTIDQPILLRASLQGSKCVPVERGVAFGQPLIKCQSNLSKQFPEQTLSSDDIASGFSTWPLHHLGTMATTGNIVGLTPQNSNMLVQILQQQQQQQSVLPESSHALNVQPSCLVVPSVSSNGFPAGSNPVSLDQNSSFNTGTVVDYSLLPSQCNMSVGFGQISDCDFKNVGVLNVYSNLASVSPPMSSRSVCAESSTGWRVQNPVMNVDPASRSLGFAPNTCNTQGSYAAKTGSLPDQRQGRNLGFVGKGSCIPSRFAADDAGSLTGDLSQGKVCLGDGDRVKQEINLDFMENSKVGIPVLPHFSPNDLMSVLSK